MLHSAESFREALSRRELLRRAGILAVATGAGPVILSACGGDDTDTTGAGAEGTDATSAAGAETTTAAPAAAVEVSMWGQYPELTEGYEAVLAEFETAEPEVAIAFEAKPFEQYAAALSTALAGGAAPDLIGFTPGVSVREAAAAGQILDLTGSVEADNLIAPARAQVEFDGGLWGSPIGAYTVGWFYQKPTFERLGLEIPRTWDDFTAVCQTILDAGETPISMPARDGVIPYFFYILAVGSILGEEGVEPLRTGARKLTDPDLLPAMQFLLDLEPFYNQGYQAVNYAEGKAEFANERAAILIGGTADYFGYLDVNPDIDAGVFGFPSPSGGPTVTVTGMLTVYAVNAATENPDEAARFVNWLTTVDAQQVVADELLSRPVAEGATGTNPVVVESVEAGEVDLPVWYDDPAMSATFDIFLTEGAGLFTGRLSPEELAGMLQEGITTS